MNKLICTLLAICSLQISSAQNFGKLIKQTPGVVSYSFRGAFAKDVPGTLDKIKAMGVTNIEFSNFFGQSPEALRAMLDQRGMRCTSIGMSYADFVNTPETVIKNAKTLGAEFVRIGSIPVQGKMTSEIIQKAVADFNTAGRLMKKNGLVFCFHNHGPEFAPAGDLFNGTYFDYLVQKTDPDAVFFEMDVLWVFFPGHDPVALLKKYPKRFKLMHVKDLKQGLQRGSGPTTNVPVGTGQIDYNVILREVPKTAVKYLYIEDESALSEQQVPLSLAFMKGL